MDPKKSEPGRVRLEESGGFIVLEGDMAGGALLLDEEAPAKPPPESDAPHE